MRIRESDQLKTVLELYGMEIHQKISMLNYQKLKTMVKRSIDQKLRLRNFDARHGRIETGAVVKNRKGKSGVEGGKVSVTSGKKKANVRRETNAVSDMRVTIMHKNRHRKPPHPLSQPHHEVEVCRGRDGSEAEVTMGPFFDNRAEPVWKVFARDRLVNIGILPNVNSIKTNRDVKQEISVCSAHKAYEQQNKKPEKSDHSPKRKRKRRQKCCVCCEENCTTSGLRLAKLGHIGFSKRRTGPEKPDAKSLGTNSKSTVHSVCATSSEYPGKERTIAWKNTSQKILISEVPT